MRRCEPWCPCGSGANPEDEEHVLRLFREQLARRDEDPWRYQDTWRDGDDEASEGNEK